MIKYILLLIPNIIMWILGVVLAPVLPIFCNDKGELPDCLYWFTTWDQLQLNFDDEWIHDKWPYFENISPSWLKVYLCRVAWLIRNTSYGFAYSFSGYDYDFYKIKWTKIEDKDGEDESRGYDTDNNPWLFGGFRLAGTKKYPLIPFGVNWYFGWKFSIDDPSKKRAMYAMRLNPFKKI